MTPPGLAPETRIAACSVRLLEVHLDAADPATAQAVAGAVERVADELVTWHDAVVVGDPEHVVRRRPTLRSVDRAAPPTALSPGALERVSVAAQTVSRDLDGVADEVERHADDVAAGRLGTASTTSSATQLADRGRSLARTLHALAEAVDEVGVVAVRERRRDASAPDRAAAGVHRAEQNLRRLAEAAARDA